MSNKGIDIEALMALAEQSVTIEPKKPKVRKRKPKKEKVFKPVKVKPDPVYSSVESFIEAMKLMGGMKKVPAKFLYPIYKQWADAPHKHRAFFVYFSRYFEPKRKTTYRYYMLNYNSWELQLKVKEHGEKKKQAALSGATEVQESKD